VSGRLVLYALPPLMIAAAGLRGCRPAERGVIAAIAAAAGAAALAALGLAQALDSFLWNGAAYAATAVFTSAFAMLVRRRAEPGGGDSPDAGGEPEPPPFDWDRFETQFWIEVARRRISSGGGRTRSSRSPSPSRSRR
jgi:hypothetical protein